LSILVFLIPYRELRDLACASVPELTNDSSPGSFSAWRLFTTKMPMGYIP
jgi:hypothetical protein